MKNLKKTIHIKVPIEEVFNAITSSGVGNAAPLAGGISQALITTAAGLSVAIIALMFHRYFRGRVDEIVVKMEEEAIKMVDVLHNNRTTESSTGKTEKAA